MRWADCCWAHFYTSAHVHVHGSGISVESRRSVVVVDTDMAAVDSNHLELDGFVEADIVEVADSDSGQH